MQIRGLFLRRLFLKGQGRSADALAFEIDCDLDAVGDLDEGNAAVHAIVFAVEGHGATDVARAGALAGNFQGERFGLRHSANRKRAGYIKGSRTGLYNLAGMKGDQGILVGVEEVFALQLVVLHPASGINRGGLNLDVQDARGDIWGCKGEGGIPLLEFTFNCDRRFDIEFDGALYRRDGENRSLSQAEWRGKRGCEETNCS
jgi:hypothetical protein